MRGLGGIRRRCGTLAAWSYPYNQCCAPPLLPYTPQAYNSFCTLQAYPLFQMEFIEAPAFSRYLADYLDAGQYRSLQTALAVNPDSGDVMPGTGGFRKLRWSDARRRKGRRGGLRVIYFHFVFDHQIWLMTLYDKNEAEDLTAGEKKLLKAALQVEQKARARTRAARPQSSTRRRQ